MNGPTVLFNGAAIYDFAQQRYLYTAFLPESVRGHICRLLEDLPETALESSIPTRSPIITCI